MRTLTQVQRNMQRGFNMLTKAKNDVTKRKNNMPNALARRAGKLYGVILFIFSYALLCLFFLFYPSLSDKSDFSDIDVRGESQHFCEVCYSIKDSIHWENFLSKFE